MLELLEVMEGLIGPCVYIMILRKACCMRPITGRGCVPPYIITNNVQLIRQKTLIAVVVVFSKYSQMLVKQVPVDKLFPGAQDNNANIPQRIDMAPRRNGQGVVMPSSSALGMLKRRCRQWQCQETSGRRQGGRWPCWGPSCGWRSRARQPAHTSQKY